MFCKENIDKKNEYGVQIKKSVLCIKSVLKDLKSASACPTKSDVFSSRPNF